MTRTLAKRKRRQPMTLKVLRQKRQEILDRCSRR